MNPVMKKLRDYIQSNSEFKHAFEEAVNRALTYQLSEFKAFNINTIDYLNFYERLTTWVPTENLDGSRVMDHIHVAYFVDRLFPVTPQAEPGHLPPWKWFIEWLEDWVQEIGKFADKPESITPESLATFYASPKYHMQDYPVPKPGGWKTFNEFFARKIDMKKRPIDQNPRAITSPADSEFAGSWRIEDKAQVTIKSVPWYIHILLKDTAHGAAFKGGLFMHTILFPYDYHRTHFPISGTVLEAKVVPGLAFMDIVAVPNNNRNGGEPGFTLRRIIQNRDSTEDDPPKHHRVLQARGCIVVDTNGTENDIGLVAIFVVGLAMVSSVVLSVEPGDVVKKGDEMAYFQMGGSDVVLCFEAKAKVKFTAVEQHYDVGAQIALTL